MRGVIHKAMADLRRRKLQAVVVGLVVLLSSLSGTLAVSLLVESDAPFDRALDHASGAHLVIRYDGALATQAQLVATSQAPLVAAAGGPWTETPGLVVESGFGPRIGLAVLGRADPGGPVDRLTLLSGRWVRGEDEVVVARRIQKPLGVQVGDDLKIAPGQGVESLRVVGIAAAVGDSSDGWLLPSQAAAIHPEEGSVKGRTAVARPTLMFYRLQHPGTPADIALAATQVTAGIPAAAVLTASNWLDEKRSADTTTAVMIPFLVAFSVFALVAAAMIIGNVVSGAVIAGYREIGIMKAVGFTPAQVVMTLAIQMMVPGTVGAVIGIAGGVAASQPFLLQTAAAFDLPPEPALVPAVLAGCLITALAVVAVATLLPTAKAGRMTAAEAISTGSAPRGTGGRGAGRLFGRLPGPRTFSLGMSDAVGRPVRSTMTLLAVAIGVATITFATGLTRSLNLVKHSLTHDQTVQATLVRDGGRGGDGTAGLSDAQAVALLDGQRGTVRYVAETFLPVHMDGAGQPVRLFGYRGDARWVGWELLSGRWYTGPGEAVAPQALLAATGKRLGDSITFSLDGRQEALRLVGTIFDTSGDNMLVRAGSSATAALAPGATPDSYYIQVGDGVDPRAYVRGLVAASGNPMLDIRLTTDSDADSTFLLIEGVLGGLAVVLTLISMAGVFNTVVLNTREKARDTAILRALGMTPRQVVTMVLVSVGLIGFAGALAGIPAGRVLHGQVLGVMGQVAASTGVPWRIYQVFPLGLLLLMAGAGVAVGGVAGWLPATWAARAGFSELLASE